MEHKFDIMPMKSNHQTVAHEPDMIVLDFKQVFPQFTPENQARMIVNHKTVFLDPYTAKQFLSVLQDNIERYEKTYGPIEKSTALKVAEKNNDGKKEFKPSYMG